MSQYSHLSTIDPEFAAIADQLSRNPPVDDVVARRRPTNGILQEYLKSYLPAGKFALTLYYY
ncbi:hypothetical protein SCP_0802890 [Sparassis crispa]|uniref:Uncharacterized protein n=1 Tax=Sparassis crispa TaxID=139825 RepID=A0A401GU69_9APHY|nr:hypothetical protein SCP_0802890 [Sparassis crispa]GBE85767.1 hypothetical protein SCP_0802890 [Sparassis crispa]